MSNEITLNQLHPALGNTNIGSDTTYIGIDFGTSTTVISIASLNLLEKKIECDPIRIEQKMTDGATCKSERIPSVIAVMNKKIYVGEGAASLKYQLKKDKNIWYSFKMELGEDLGAKYYESELANQAGWEIKNPKDAVRIFFKYLKAEIQKHIKESHLSENIKYSVSIPASFEANQRQELIDALASNGIDVSRQALIDEPNAAFLSYVQESALDGVPLLIPENHNLKVFVFDFGGGTCDISILELGRDYQGIYSKNIAISRFEKLGGDDIDRYIACHYLYPRLLKENGVEESAFKTPERKRIISGLLKAAELLKIQTCKNICNFMSNQELPILSQSDMEVDLQLQIKIETRKGILSTEKVHLSYKEMTETMTVFLKNDMFSNIKRVKGEDDYISIFNPIKSALKKANLKKDDIDYLLFVGGSSKSPYIQSALKKYFDESDLLIPQDLQAHVSRGAAIHSLIYNGFNKNIINPISSESILVITKDETPKVLIPAGTLIPSDTFIIDDLVTSREGQKFVELPICVGSKEKLLFNIKISANHPLGFPSNTAVSITVEFTADKLLLITANAGGEPCHIDPINPFANKDLTTQERMILKAEKMVNIEALKNGGKPTQSALLVLKDAYEKGGNDFRAAETMEFINELYPSKSNLNGIGVLYSNAGNSRKAIEFYEQAYEEQKSATVAFNLGHQLKYSDIDRSEAYLKEAHAMDPDHPHILFELGRSEKAKGLASGTDKIKRAFDIWKKEYENKVLTENNYGWLASAAETLGMKQYAHEIRANKPKFTGEKLYDQENLTHTKRVEIDLF